MLAVEIWDNDEVMGFLKIANVAGETTGNCQFEWVLKEGDKEYLGFVMHKQEDGVLRLIERTIHEVLCEKRFQEAEAYKVEGNDVC